MGTRRCRAMRGQWMVCKATLIPLDGCPRKSRMTPELAQAPPSGPALTLGLGACGGEQVLRELFLRNVDESFDAAFDPLVGRTYACNAREDDVNNALSSQIETRLSEFH